MQVEINKNNTTFDGIFEASFPLAGQGRGSHEY